ncbi:MAG: alpha-glucosidase [Spirochaetota bacterium]
MKQWWKESVVYQIYPQSFYDSNGDGVGDLNGIIMKLDYLTGLGIDIIWLNPIYDSPLDDNGYDIRDYRSILAEYGTMEDFDELLTQMHKRGLKLVMDLVVNHTSDEHTWFVESRKSRDNPFRDYYIWKKPVDGGPPNGWQSFFGGSTWAYDDHSGEYYLHLFSKKQVDLNWENQSVRNGIYEMMRWWLDKGIDGFRMDVINLISKKFHPGEPERDFFFNGPRVHEYLREMNRKVLSDYDIVSIGECPGSSTGDARLYAGFDTGEVNMVFQFEHIEVDHDGNKWEGHRFQPAALREVMFKWQKELDGVAWNSIYLTNHDQPRALSRFGNDGPYRKTAAKLLAMFTLSLQGTPYIYQGEEIGMTNAYFDSIDDYRDIESLNFYSHARENGMDVAEIFRRLQYISRDNSRTPMQWNASPNAGFTSGTPWIRVNPNYTSINAESDRDDPDSIYRFYKRMICFRRMTPALVYGSFIPYLEDDPVLYVYERDHGGNRYQVLLNMSAETVSLEGKNIPVYGNCHTCMSNYDGARDGNVLRPYEGVILHCIVTE